MLQNYVLAGSAKGVEPYSVKWKMVCVVSMTECLNCRGAVLFVLAFAGCSWTYLAVFASHSPPISQPRYNLASTSLVYRFASARQRPCPAARSCFVGA